MDLLLDINVVVDICTDRQPFAQKARQALAVCIARGGRIWGYAGSVQTLVYVTCSELARQYQGAGQAVTRHQAMFQARRILAAFCSNKQWLAALSGEGDVFGATDPEDEQLLRALDRFPTGSIRLLTRDAALLSLNNPRLISPSQYLDSQLGSPSPLTSPSDPPISPIEPTHPTSPISFIDLKRQQDALRPQLERSVHRVLLHGQYIMGPEVKQLEEKLAEYVGVKHCIAASSGTDTLLIAMMALGVGPGDEVITTPFTFIATGEMIALLGAKPVFVDIDARTYNLDPSKIEAAITSKTRAIMPVSLYGQCADMDAINAIADKHGLAVIEDGAQSFGATYKGRRSCGLSTIGSTSFFPSKPLGCYGDGGALFTNDDSLAKAMREIRVHGQDRRYHHPRIGLNGRLDTIQAAILLAKLERFDDEVARRQAIGLRYTELIVSSDLPDHPDFPIFPFLEPFNTSVYAQYTISVDDRDALIARLKTRNIPTAVHYPVPLHLQPAFASYGYREGDFPIAEAAAKRVLSLPMGADLTDSDQLRIVAALAFGL